MYVATPVPEGCPLHPRQWNMLRLLAQGLSVGEIALQMGAAISTVRSALHEGYVKLGVHQGAQAVAVAWEAGWMDPVGVEWADRRVTAAQGLYLDAFDRFVHAHSDELAQQRARKEMTHHLGSMCMERGLEAVPVGGKQRMRTPRLEALFAMLTAC